MPRQGSTNTTLSQELYDSIQASAAKLEKQQEDRLKPISIPEMIAIMHRFWVEQKGNGRSDDN